MPNDETASNPAEEQESRQPHGRASAWQSASETLKYVREAWADKTIVIRDQDKLSTHLILLAVFFAVLFVGISAIYQDWSGLHARLGLGKVVSLRALGFGFTVAADLLYLAALFWFVLRRFGVLRTMSKRHALICSQLMMGASIFTVVCCVNIVAVIILFCLGGRLSDLFN